MATKAARPLSESIAAQDAEAQRLGDQAREARARAALLQAEKEAREDGARRAWADSQVGRMREIFAAVDAVRSDALAAFRAGLPDAHAAWVRWRAAAKSAESEWAVIASAYNKAHAGEGLRAPSGRSFTGTSAGHVGERWSDFTHRLTLNISDEAGAAARARALAALAAAVGSVDVAAVEASVSPVARFFRGRVTPNPSGTFTTSEDVRPWPGRDLNTGVTFSPDGFVDVYDEHIATALDAYPGCVRIPLVEGRD